MSKSLLENFNELTSCWSEALELFPADKVQPLSLRDSIRILPSLTLDVVDWSKVYEEYSDVFNAGERQWFSDENNSMLLGGLDICLAIKIAEEHDDVLASAIICYLYKCIIASNVVEVEDEKKRLGTIATALRDLVNGKDISNNGPASIDFNALQSGLPGMGGIGSILQNLVPKMTKVMNSPELQEFLKVAMPQQSINSGQQPDISSLINTTVGALGTDQGKKFVGVLSNDFSDLIPKNK